MKSILSTFALMTAVCLGAEVAPPADPTPEPASDDTTTEVIEHTVQQAREQAKHASEHAVAQAKHAAEAAKRQAKIAVQLAQSKLAFDDVEPEEPELGDIPVVGQTFNDGYPVAFDGPGKATAQPLIIRTSESDPAAVTNLQEDLSVMSRILNKAVEREVGHQAHEAAMGIVLSALPGTRRPQSLYLEGYGALFLINVKFPLVAAAAKEEEKPEKAPDTTWEQTKRELYGQRSNNVRVWSFNPAGDAVVEYNAEQVDNLKKEIIESLKNGSNIRGLKPEESVTIAVVGGRGGPGVARVKQLKTSNTGRNVRKADVFAFADSSRGQGRETVLTIRAKKSDIDAYAKGTIDLAEFTKRTSTSAY